MDKGLKTEELILSARKARVDRVVAQRTRRITVVLEDLEDPHNVAAVLRTCEGLGVQEVHAVTRRYAFHPNPKITNGAEKWLDLCLYGQTERCLAELKSRGYLICATDLGEGSCSLAELPTDRPLALVFGTEKTGVTPAVLAHCDRRFQIPMLGFAQSFNISVAAAICLSHLVLTRPAPEAGEDGFDYSPAERERLRERFYALSVKQRHRLFPRLSTDGMNWSGPRSSDLQKERP